MRRLWRRAAAIFLAAAVIMCIPVLAGVSMPGSWSVSEDPAVTDEVRQMLEEAADQLSDGRYEPVALLATQLVSGTNYCVLCKRTTPVDTGYVHVYLYRNLAGEVSVIRVKEITFSIDDEIPEAEYQIIIDEDSDSYMIVSCPEAAAAGEKVNVHTADVLDGDAHVSVDGDEHFGQFIEYANYEFVMPDHDVVIKVWAVGNGLA